MIQLLLYFALGFLCAAFLAALVAPAVWRRAVMLTRRRIEASVPLTLDEIRAEKDSLKAEHAIATRRLEMDLKAAKTKVSELSVKLARGSKDIKAIATERETNKVELSRIEAEARELRDELRRREDGMQALSQALTRTEGMLQAQRAEFARLGIDFEEASFSASARQIEIVARESEIDRLNSDIATLKNQRKAIERNTRNADSAVNMAKESAQNEKQRADALDARLVRLMADLSDREERLERRDREVAQLRERLKPILASPPSQDRELRLMDLQVENARLEAEIAALIAQRAAAAQPAQSADRDASGRQERLETRVAALMRENKALRKKLAAPGAKDDAASRELREQMQALAAEVVHLTASMEGATSPINAALAKSDVDAAQSKAPLSLADRIRALRENPPASA